MSDNEKIFWIDVQETYKINARDEDHARQLLSDYLDGDWQVPVKLKSCDYQIEEDTNA